MSYDINNVSVPRFSQMSKGDSGYGFNLHGDKNQPGQTISAVDPDSPAELGGLREGDRVIEVNGVNVENKTHGDVVKLIKENPSDTRLLVCDKDTLAYLKENNRACTVDMVNLATVVPPKIEEPAPVVANGDAVLVTPEIVQEKVEESAPASVEESTPPPAQVTKEEDETAPADTTPDEVKQLNSVLDEQEKPAEPEEQTDSHAAPAEPPVEPPVAEEPTKPVDNGGHVGHVRDMEAARPAGNKRRSAKASGEAWGNKVNYINSL